MSPSEENPKWRYWRPRFTVRTLAIIVTLVCAYFGAWEATKYHVAPEQQPVANFRFIFDGRYHVLDARTPLPFFVIRDEYSIEDINSPATGRTAYYLWIFGWEVKLLLRRTTGM